MQVFPLNYLKSNTICWKLRFILTTVVAINVQHFTQDNLLLLISYYLHEMIFGTLEHPAQYTVNFASEVKLSVLHVTLLFKALVEVDLSPSYLPTGF